MMPAITAIAAARRVRGARWNRANASAPLTDSASIAGMANRAGTRTEAKSGSRMNQA